MVRVKDIVYLISLASGLKIGYQGGDFTDRYNNSSGQLTNYCNFILWIMFI